MAFVRDTELVQLLQEIPPLVTGLNAKGDWYSKESPVQPCSIDLTVGRIFVPETKTNRLGGLQNPRGSYQVDSGGTAIVETMEEVNVPSSMAAIGFPPSRVSARGLLMTNPGHIDPGFKGHVSFTVINMGQDPFYLKRGDMICTLLFSRLDSRPERDFQDRYGGPRPLGEETLSVLSKDFLSIERRAKTVINRQALLLSAAATVLVAIIAAVGAMIGGGLVSNDRVAKLEERLAVLESQSRSGLNENPTPLPAAVPSPVESN